MIKDFHLEEICTLFHLTEDEAAKELGCSVTTLKKYARLRGIKRWPFRKIRSLKRQIEAIKEKRRKCDIRSLRRTYLTQQMNMEKQIKSLNNPRTYSHPSSMNKSTRKVMKKRTKRVKKPTSDYYEEDTSQKESLSSEFVRVLSHRSRKSSTNTRDSQRRRSDSKKKYLEYHERKKSRKIQVVDHRSYNNNNVKLRPQFLQPNYYWNYPHHQQQQTTSRNFGTTHHHHSSPHPHQIMYHPSQYNHTNGNRYPQQHHPYFLHHPYPQQSEYRTPRNNNSIYIPPPPPQNITNKNYLNNNTNFLNLSRSKEVVEEEEPIIILPPPPHQLEILKPIHNHKQQSNFLTKPSSNDIKIVKGSPQGTRIRLPSFNVLEQKVHSLE